VRFPAGGREKAAWGRTRARKGETKRQEKPHFRPEAKETLLILPRLGVGRRPTPRKAEKAKSYTGILSGFRAKGPKNTRKRTPKTRENRQAPGRNGQNRAKKARKQAKQPPNGAKRSKGLLYGFRAPRGRKEGQKQAKTGRRPKTGKGRGPKGRGRRGLGRRPAGEAKGPERAQKGPKTGKAAKTRQNRAKNGPRTGKYRPFGAWGPRGPFLARRARKGKSRPCESQETGPQPARFTGKGPKYGPFWGP